MKVALLTDAPYSRDVRAQRTVQALRGVNAEIMVFDQGFDVEESRGMLKNAEHFSSPVPSAKAARFVWHAKNHLAPRLSLNNLNRAAYNALCSFGPETIHLVNPFLGDAVLRYINEYPQCQLVYEAYEYWPEYLFDTEFGVKNSIRNHLATTEQKLLQRSVAFVTVSRPIAEFYNRIVPHQNVHVVFNANVRENVSQTQQKLVVNNPVKVVFSGQFAADRNVDMLLHAVALVQHRISVTLLGRGPQEEHYKQIISNLNIEKSVEIKKPVPADVLIEELESYDIGIHLVSPQTLQQDGAAPNKVFDYLRANLGIISVETKGVKSLGIDESIAYITPYGVGELAKILDELAENRERVLAMKQKAAQLKQQFTYEHEMQKVKTIYQGLMNDENSCSI